MQLAKYIFPINFHKQRNSVSISSGKNIIYMKIKQAHCEETTTYEDQTTNL